MFPIKVEVTFATMFQVNEWKSRFNMPIVEALKLSGITNYNHQSMKYLFRKTKFKSKLFYLPRSPQISSYNRQKDESFKFAEKFQIQLEDLAELQLFELYLMPYNPNLRKHYESCRQTDFFRKYPIAPQSSLSGITSVRRILYHLAEASGGSLSPVPYDPGCRCGSTGMFDITISANRDDLKYPLINRLHKVGNIRMEVLEPKEPTIDDRVFFNFNEASILLEAFNKKLFFPYDYEGLSSSILKLYSGSKPKSPTDVSDESKLIYAWHINKDPKKEASAMNLSVKTPKYTYFHGSIPFEQLNSFLSAISKHEQDWSIHCVDEPKQLSNTKYSIHTLPFEDTTMVLVFEEKTSNPQTYYIISIPYNVTSSYISDILDTCMPEKYRITIRCNSIVEAQTLQLRLAVMEKEQSTQLGAINVIQRHLDAFLGDDSVWGFSGSKISLTKTDFKELGLRISMAINHDDQAVQATYTLSGVTEKDMQDIVRYVQKSLMPQLVSSLRPSFKVFFIKSSNVPSTNLSVRREQ